MSVKRMIGIEFGTSNSLVIWENIEKLVIIWRRKES